MRVDLHNHTYLCNHAVDTPENYILKAIELGIDVYGFSEHAPMRNFEDGYRLRLEDKQKYETMILNLKEKYKNKIEILLAYEVDFISDDYLLDDILDAKVDYLIGSVHYLDDWGFDNPEFMSQYSKKDIDVIWEDYFSAVLNMVQSKKFDIVGHFDLMKIFNFLPNKNIVDMSKDVLKAIKKEDMTVEINSAGFRKPVKQQYPSNDLLKAIFDEKIDITFSSDAHKISDIGFEYDKVKSIAKEIGFDKTAIYRNKEKILVNF